MFKYVPYVLMFAVITAFIYTWGLWRAQRKTTDLNNMLSAKGISKIKKALNKKGEMTKEDMEIVVKDIWVSQPFSKDRMGVTEPSLFVDSLIPYMIKQKIVKEEKKKGKTFYTLYGK
ncbi:MAG TPA: hypothetical protein IAD10_06705 [Candidatus Fimicola cottocaccae]|nr:hypothetical protein [Candidatus Fimicola cottocaccae]